MPKILVDGIEYVPVSAANPSAEQIARGIMEHFWGELSAEHDWEEEAGSLRVRCDDTFRKDEGITVEEMTAAILKRISNKPKRSSK
jgi:hypothetical protein